MTMHRFGGTILVLLFAIEGMHAALSVGAFAKWRPTAANWEKFKNSHAKQYKSTADEAARYHYFQQLYIYIYIIYIYIYIYVYIYIYIYIYIYTIGNLIL